jgi:MFS family permease
VFGLAAAGAALADSTGLLIAMRALQGLGAALVLPATLSIIVSVFPRDERSKAIAVWTAVGGLGIALGPVGGGVLIEAADWSAAFWLFTPLVIAALVGMTVVPESRDPRHVGLDVPGATLGTAGLTALDWWSTPRLRVSAWPAGWRRRFSPRAPQLSPGRPTRHTSMP